MVLGNGNGDGVEYITGGDGFFVVASGGLGSNQEIQIYGHHHFTAAFEGNAVVVCGPERGDAFDAVVRGFVGLKPLIEEGVEIGLCTLNH